MTYSLFGMTSEYSVIVFLVSLATLTVQIAASLYGFRIRRYLSFDMALVFGGLNFTLLAQDSVIVFFLWIAGHRPGTQIIESIGFFIGFAVPLTMALLMLALQRHLAFGLRGMNRPKGGGRFPPPPS